MGFFLFGMGSAMSTHQRTQPRAHTQAWGWTHAHLHTCIHRCNKDGRYTFEPLLADVDSWGWGWVEELVFLFPFPFHFCGLIF